jgi:very-short-patch-repair endonuclease
MWPAAGLVVETDGWETHGTRVAFLADRRKDAALTAAGYRVVRFSADDLRDRPGIVAARLAALLYTRASASRNASSSGSSIE